MSLKPGSILVGEPDSRIANASFAVWNERTRTAYFVDEQDSGSVSAWAYREGEWQERGRQTSGGVLPCYVALDPDGTRLAVANYGDGSVALIEVDAATGELGDLVGVRYATNQGPQRERRAGAHAHCVLFDESGDALFHVDLGADKVVAYPLEHGRLGTPQVALELSPGSGPRHLLLTPDRSSALLLCELSAELILLNRKGPKLEIAQAVPTAPEPPPEGNLGGHLGMDAHGSILVTNRGHDSLVSLHVEEGRLAPQGWVSTGGKSPRHFFASSEGVLVAHEEGGGLTLLPHPSGQRGQAAPLAQADVRGPVFILNVE